MEIKKEGSFARKVRNRKFAIENSWKNDTIQIEENEFIEDTVVHEDDSNRWTVLNENLAEADAVKYYDGYPMITKVEMLDRDGRYSNMFRVLEPFSVKIDCAVKEKVEDAVFGIAIHRIDGVHCYGTNTWRDGKSNIVLDSDRSIEFKCYEMALLPGQYTLDIAIEKTPGIPIDYYTHCYAFEVCSDTKEVGLVKMKHEWSL